MFTTAGAMNNESLKEFEPDRRAIAVDRLQRRVRSICEARINKAWPIGRRLDVVSAALCLRNHNLPPDVRRFVENDASALTRLVRFTTAQRLAADSLCKYVAQPGVDLNKINPADERWWRVEANDDQDRDPEDG